MDLNIFNKNKELKKAFRAIKYDVKTVENRQNTLKSSMSDWIVFLDHENRDLKQRIRTLEKKIALFEDCVDEEKLTVLRQI
jgi:predicted  nucleic acid-binding Zn-ribbon protein